jgi:coenzyme F420 hydrogenase subunit beta
MSKNQNTITIERGELYAGYANATVREYAASGGIVSAILLALLEQGQIDGALVSRIQSTERRIVAQTHVARSADEIFAHGGSSYIDTPVLQKIHEMQDVEGRYAVVMLPCQVRALEAMARRNPRLRQTFSPIIALFCRGTVNSAFYDDFFCKINISPEDVETVKVKRKYVGGTMYVHLHNQQLAAIPFVKINAYRQAGFHAKRLCAWCTEHLGIAADISVGGSPAD